MTAKKLLVDDRFPNRFNCSQTVLSLHAGELGLSEQTALKLASGFGSGMSCAETCGAVTASYMVIGMRHGHVTADPDAKAKTKQLILDFNEKFKTEHGALTCKELIGFDIATPEGHAGATKADVFHKQCPAFLKTACDILEKHF